MLEGQGTFYSKSFSVTRCYQNDQPGLVNAIDSRCSKRFVSLGQSLFACRALSPYFLITHLQRLFVVSQMIKLPLRIEGYLFQGSGGGKEGWRRGPRSQD